VGLFIWVSGFVFVGLGFNWALLLLILLLRFVWDIVDSDADDDEFDAAAVVVVVWFLTKFVVVVETGDDNDWLVSVGFVFSNVSKFLLLVFVVCCWFAEFDAMLA